MKQPSLLLALLTTGLILASILTSLAVSSPERDLCGNSFYEARPGQESACFPTSLSTSSLANQPTPTLAPPRPEVSSEDQSSAMELKGQPVFVKVETDDQNDIEVGWAAP